jgi:hypothetical protein
MKKKYFLLLVLVAALSFWAAGETRSILTKAREKQNAAHADQSALNPPLVVLTKVVLGGFSGLVVDILWMRLINLQTEGKVFEIVQLADWISKLEPHFTAIWAFHAWNMAYNISILYTNPEHRRLWINNAIQLLRNDGLKYNPADPDLYRELGWIYQHKIGQSWDDMHLYYKLKLAGEMEDLFGGPRPEYAKPDARTIKMRDEYKLLPEMMQKIEQTYGPLDWRLPETHSLYWAWRGLHSVAAGKDTSSCDHMIFQSMAAAFLHGRLFFDREKGVYFTTPRPDLLPGVRKAYKDAIKRQNTDIFMKSYAGFLSEAVFICHVFGDDQGARELFNELLSADPDLKSRMDFETYLRKCGQLDIAGMPQADAVAWIEGLLCQAHACPEGTKKENEEQLRDKAFSLWKQYTLNPKNLKDSKMFPDFETIEKLALRRTGEKKSAPLDNK